MLEEYNILRDVTLCTVSNSFRSHHRENIKYQENVLSYILITLYFYVIL
jgi:hypothetical protein